MVGACISRSECFTAPLKGTPERGGLRGEHNAMLYRRVAKEA